MIRSLVRTLIRWIRRIDHISYERDAVLGVVEDLHQRVLAPFLDTALEPYARCHAHHEASRTCRRSLRNLIAEAGALAFLPLRMAYLATLAERHPPLRGGGPWAIGIPPLVNLDPSGLPGFEGLTFLEVKPRRARMSLGAQWQLLQGFRRVGCHFPFVWLKGLDVASRMRWLGMAYRPEKVVVQRESDCVVSLLTDQVHRFGGEVLNVMHGDKVYEAFDAFGWFDRNFVWHPWYAELARELRCRFETWEIYRPPSVFRSLPLPAEGEGGVLVLLPPKELLGPAQDRVIEVFRRVLAACGRSVRLRCHPMYPPHRAWRQLAEMPGCEWSDPGTVPFLGDLAGAGTVVGWNSTGLIQSALTGRRTLCVLAGLTGPALRVNPFLKGPNVKLVEVEALARDPWIRAGGP